MSRNHAGPFESSESVESFVFAVRYRSVEIDGGESWLDYSLHPPTKLGLHNALLAEHDRFEILSARGGWFECGVFVLRHGCAEPLTQDGAEHLFAVLPPGEVKWLDLCHCLLPPLPETESEPPPAAAQLPLFPHIHTPYDELDAHPSAHALDIAA